MDRRALFFLGAAVVCAALIAATPEDLRWVPTAMSIAYVVLALWSYLDARSRHLGNGSGEPEPPSGHDQPNRPVT